MAPEEIVAEVLSEPPAGGLCGARPSGKAWSQRIVPDDARLP